MVQGDMTTKEIIDELRDQADVIGPGTECNLLHAAADRLKVIEDYETKLKKALVALEEFDSSIPCDEMSGDSDEWCEKNCKIEYKTAVAKCWKRYLYERTQHEL